MFPELLKLPFLDITIKSYGLMVVAGFLLALFVTKKMCKWVLLDYEKLINAAFYSFIVGIIGARVFHVVHYYDNFNNIWQMLAIWKGGLELLGGVIPAVLFILLYLKFSGMNILLSLDILAPALMIGIALGRIGCLLNGCCYGAPTNSAVGIVFPYNSIPYNSQAYPDYPRKRTEPLIDLPAEYYGYQAPDGQWQQADEYSKLQYHLKPKNMLTEQQRADVVSGGRYCAMAVHPTQIYSSLAAMLNCGLLILFWRFYGSGQREAHRQKFAAGTTGALMLVLYSITRFSIEMFRGDNPYEVGQLTISQLLSVALFVCGVMMFAGLSSKNKSK